MTKLSLGSDSTGRVMAEEIARRSWKPSSQVGWDPLCGWLLFFFLLLSCCWLRLFATCSSLLSVFSPRFVSRSLSPSFACLVRLSWLVGFAAVSSCTHPFAPSLWFSSFFSRLLWLFWARSFFFGGASHTRGV